MNRIVGVGSCTAAGCHGGGHPNQVIGSEYNVWISQDPHARAYSILFDERSLWMERLLHGGSQDGTVEPQKDARCLACHSMTDAVARNVTQDVISDGVGCEACHGPASRWVSRHYEHSLSSAERLELGLWDTKSLVTRGRICAHCHVGGPATFGPDHDVNHDLIAAGHPRLQFELSAFHQAMPKHWDEIKDRAPWGADFDAFVWVIGQATTAEAAVKQIASRASKTDQKHVWPEFSEWSCSSCHHELRLNEGEVRQSRIANAGGPAAHLFELDGWNDFMTRRHAAELSAAVGINSETGDRVEKLTQQLATAMGRVNPDRKKVGELAGRASEELGKWALMIQDARTATRDVNVDAMAQAVLREQVASRVVDWSSAAQAYNALSCVQDTKLARVRAKRGTANDALSNSLHSLFTDLSVEHHQPSDYLMKPDAVQARLKQISTMISMEQKSP